MEQLTRSRILIALYYDDLSPTEPTLRPCVEWLVQAGVDRREAISLVEEIAIDAIDLSSTEPIIGALYEVKCGWSDKQRATLEKIEQHTDNPKYGKGTKTVYFWKGGNDKNKGFSFISYDLHDTRIIN